MDEYDVLRRDRRVGRVAVTPDGLNTRFDCACERAGDEILRLAAVCAGRLVPLGVMLPDGGRLLLSKKYSKNALRELGFSEPSAFALIAPGESFALPEPAAEPIRAPEPEPEPKRAARPEPAPPRPPAEARKLTIPVSFALELDLPEPPGGLALAMPPERKALAPPTPSASKPALPDAPETPGAWRACPDPRALFRDGDLISEEIRGALRRADGEATRLAVPLSPEEPFPMMPVFCFGEPEEIEGRGYVVFKIKNGALTL
jgi:hypothetical protein